MQVLELLLAPAEQQSYDSAFADSPFCLEGSS